MLSISSGVRVYANTDSRNRNERNTFEGNVGIRIDLDDNGVTANDPGDADAGPNNLQNKPVIASMIKGIGKLTITYRIDSATQHSTYPLKTAFYLVAAGASAHQMHLQSETYNVTPDSDKQITLTLPPGFRAIASCP